VLALTFVTSSVVSHGRLSSNRHAGGIHAVSRAGLLEQGSLSRLPVAAQGPISDALGAHSTVYSLSRRAGRVTALNPAQKLTTSFGPTGLVVTSGRMRLGLRLSAAGFGKRIFPVAPPRLAITGNRGTYYRPGLTEWYVNGPLGLEQGFTISGAPSTKHGERLTLAVALSGNVQPTLTRSRSEAVFTSGSYSIRYAGLQAVDAGGRALHSWLSVRPRRLEVLVDTKGARYPLTIDPFVQQSEPLVPAPVVTTVEPSEGPEAGGTKVTIKGSNLSGGTVAFGPNAGSGLPCSATECTASSPPATGKVDVTVTTVGGTSATSEADQFTYVPLPVVTAVEPGEGPEAGGTNVTIKGSNLAGGAVKFGPNAGTGVSCSGGECSATSPAGKGTADVTVTTAGGTSATGEADRFTYVPAPVVTTVEPAEGPEAGGTSVKLKGSSLTGGTVKFGPNAATGVSCSSGECTATAPLGKGTVDVTVTTAGGTSATGEPDRFTYVPAPTVTRVEPAEGPEAGGTSVTIKGSNLSGGSVKFGANVGTGVSCGASECSATSPAGKGTVDVSVTTVGGTSATGEPDRFTYVPVPVVSKVEPAEGPETGGTPVTIKGSNLSGGSVKFGASPASGVACSPTECSAAAPAGKGTVDVTITTAGGSSATGGADQFTYVPTPAVTSLAPRKGREAGGTAVTIMGSSLSGGTVKFGPNPATGVSCSASQCSATAPAGQATVHVTVTTVGGTSAASEADQFTYVAPPQVTGLAPAKGPQTGGTSVTVTGTSLGEATAVKFGSNNAATLKVESESAIKAVSPTGKGTVDVTVTTPYGTSQATVLDEYRYVPAPGVTGLAPSKGPKSGGTSVTISGTDLGEATAVQFGGASAASFKVNSETTIAAVSPPGAGTVDVTVTTPSGTSQRKEADEFHFVPPPIITKVSPSTGPAAGGTTVTITGADLNQATAVKFGSNNAASFNVNSANSMTAVSPAEEAANLDITVTTVGGISAITPKDRFKSGPPTITMLTPSTGTRAGGTAVTVTGSGFAPGTSGTSFSFGTAHGTAVNCTSSSECTVLTPAHAHGRVTVKATVNGMPSRASSAATFTYT
jgi:hypothetical protein